MEREAAELSNRSEIWSRGPWPLEWEVTAFQLGDVNSQSLSVTGNMKSQRRSTGKRAPRRHRRALHNCPNSCRGKSFLVPAPTAHARWDQQDRMRTQIPSTRARRGLCCFLAPMRSDHLTTLFLSSRSVLCICGDACAYVTS